MPTFAELGLPEAVVGVLAANGIENPFPIQAATLPDSLAGRDVLGRGRTGSGKTYAFLLPLVTRLTAQPARRVPGRPRALILAPTRELVAQINESLAPLAAATGLRSVTVIGGVGPNPQIQALRRGVDIVIACPGRLEDHVKSGHADLSGIEITILDEADHMADLGFLPPVKRLLDRTPRDGQRLLFSATLDNGVDILVKRYLSDPVVHSVDSAQSPVAAMEHHVLHVDKAARLAVLADLAASPGRTIVFARTKHGAKNLARQLNSRGVPAVELHGNLSQNARTRNLGAFSDGTATVLVATDIAARGIHVDGVSLVVHADPPVEHKAYLHRSGRTARAGNDGTVVTLMLDEQVSDVRQLTRKAGVKPTVTRCSGSSDPVLREIAPGERTFGEPVALPKPEAARPQQRQHRPSSGQQRPGRRRQPRSRRPAAASSR
ncbi:DNA/RNA helicase [Mycolicibacterium phlei]|uniref:RNA helicase n=1 Tax=Mycolicibacterium phlei DSM 43239 = CCUG 21000 TaxID=1226750 RepID=A0A5N5V7W9_MYCPH|nr:DEAD/DEAH box helicase [Mycolicibacterium phlei]VEG08351.1 DNA/RNA helicase [Mycobacteroides chelonae]AMO60231.1 ATP-dependent RNA helicase RhlE [Mycolicibacterium phlei]KAB7756720.1 RNA helicase [Mycolicibacterium phlei DSM 43239 = CCUG 21000]KXW63608.1 RNA helicase [Mycolicibacterium phlei DSM 43239 = CCUG 21000]KXW66465.1 RNA helicase [Mycolicibacterium phlei DSM 43072]